jgi:flagellar biosynthetic protein FlhB
MEAPAPVLVAKGADHLARKIREMAQAHGVPIHENQLLARSLYEAVEVGDMIPETMYKAVAAILANLAKFKNKRRPP